jgi:hypothetical protein
VINMPSYTFDPDLVASMNEKEAKEYILALKADAAALTSAPTAPAPDSSDPVGNRDVVREARQELQSAKTTGPSVPATLGPRTFTRASDRSAANAHRLVFGSNPLSVRTHFGNNTFVPSFLIALGLLNVMDRKLISTDKFIRTAEFWTPLVSRIYISVLLIIFTFMSMRSCGRLDPDNDIFLDWFLATFPLSTLPIPGPLVPVFQSLASCATAATRYKAHSPLLPTTPSTRPSWLYMLNNNLAARIPNIPALLNQYHVHLAFAQTNPLPTPEHAGRCMLFGNTVFSTAFTGASTSASDRTAITATAAERIMLFANPGFLAPYLGSKNIGNNLLDYAAEMDVLLPAEFKLAAAPTSNAMSTWRTFCGFGTTHHWFTEFARIMTDYAKHIKESCSLADISPSGHTGSLIRASSPAVHLLPIPTTRYPASDLTYSNATTWSTAQPEADELDGLYSLVNTEEVADLTGFPTRGQANVVLHSGPYYNTLPIAKTAQEINPLEGFGQVFSDHYHVPNPKA